MPELPFSRRRRVDPGDEHESSTDRPSRDIEGDLRLVLPVEVEVIAVHGAVVTERTRTKNYPSLKRAGYTNSIPPRGRGWKMVDNSHDKYTTYERKRRWPVV